MKKYIIGIIAVVIAAIIFNFGVMPFLTAHFQPVTMAMVNNQLTNDVGYSSAAIQARLSPDTIIMMVVNFVLFMTLGFLVYKAYETYVENSSN